MPLFTEAEVRTRVKSASTLQRSATSMLTERMQKQASVQQHDIFLSHAFADRELVLGIALLIESLGYTVFIDWRDDPSLDRSKITKETASKLRARMKASHCLFYSTTTGAADSKWMPWELGFKDGDNRRSAILPVVQSYATTFEGQEYLGIYPYVDKSPDKEGKMGLWIHNSANCYIHFDSWLKGREPMTRP